MIDQQWRQKLENNQGWWERLEQQNSASGARVTRNTGEIRLYAFTCGWMTADLKMMLGRAHGKIRFPVPCYLIDHPKGRILFDTGLHPDCQHDPETRLGGIAKHFHVHYRRGEEVEARLMQLGIEPKDIDFVINSHLHFDHTGGNLLVPNARIVIQRREWEAGRMPELIHANAYDKRDYDLGHLVMQVEGAHDLFGDGTIVTIPTFGHTPGHQSLKVKLGTGDVILAADACYLRQSLEELHLPKLVFDRAQMLDSMLLLRRLQAAGARIFYGHDPEFWKQVPQAPLMIR